MRKPPSFPSDCSPKNAGTILFVFGGRFGVSQTGSEDALLFVYHNIILIRYEHYKKVSIH